MMRLGIEEEDERRQKRLQNEQEFIRQRELEKKLLMQDEEIINR
jgi:hypothetical protein